MLQANASPWAQSYAYESARRLQTLTSAAGTFSYAYTAGTPSAGSALVQKLSLPNGAYITNAYDVMAQMTATWLKNSGNNILNYHGYAYDIWGQRTNAVRTEGSKVICQYDRIGQLQVATGYEPDGTTVRLQEKFGYAYDAADNLNYRTNNSLVDSFNVNGLNELSTVANSGTLTVGGTSYGQATSVTVNSLAAARYADSTFAKDGFTVSSGNNTFTAVAQDSYGRSSTDQVAVNLPATVTFTHDLNGNLLYDGNRAFGYDDENQLTSVTVTNSWQSTFVYDGFRRRRIRREYAWLNSTWTQTNEVRCVYDGNLVIQERDANNLATVSYTRGLDLSGRRQGAGGIGGLLARTDHSTITPQHAFYHADGSGNVAALINSQQALVAKYLYDPFGNVISKSGSLADVNAYRFSSKEFHANSGLSYFGRRFYDANLQRFSNQDPIGEIGGINLYRFGLNNPLRYVDPRGLDFHVVGASGLLTPGPFGYLNGDTTLENLAAGGYNALPEVGNVLSQVGNAALSAAGMLGDALQFAGDKILGSGGGDFLNTVQPEFRALGALGELTILSEEAKALATGSKLAKNCPKAAMGTAAAERAKNIAKGIPESQLGPSGKPKIHVVEHSTMKEAKDAARAEVGKGGTTVKDPSPAVGGPHFHGETQGGEKSRIHHEYPE